MALCHSLFICLSLSYCIYRFLFLCLSIAFALFQQIVHKHMRATNDDSSWWIVIFDIPCATIFAHILMPERRRRGRLVNVHQLYPKYRILLMHYRCVNVYHVYYIFESPLLGSCLDGVSLAFPMRTISFSISIEYVQPTIYHLINCKLTSQCIYVICNMKPLHLLAFAFFLCL